MQLSLCQPALSFDHRTPFMGVFYSFAFISMKLDRVQSFDINILKGALLTNPNGSEYRITGVGVDIAKHDIHIFLENGISCEWSTLKDWSIQFQTTTN